MDEEPDQNEALPIDEIPFRPHNDEEPIPYIRWDPNKKQMTHHLSLFFGPNRDRKELDISREDFRDVLKLIQTRTFRVLEELVNNLDASDGILEIVQEILIEKRPS